MPLTSTQSFGGGLPRYDPRTLRAIPRPTPAPAAAGSARNSACYYYEDDGAAAIDDADGDDDVETRNPLNKTIVYAGSRLSLPCPATSMGDEPSPLTIPRATTAASGSRRSSPRDERRAVAAPPNSIPSRGAPARLVENGATTKKSVNELIMGFEPPHVSNYYAKYEPGYGAANANGGGDYARYGGDNLGYVRDDADLSGGDGNGAMANSHSAQTNRHAAPATAAAAANGKKRSWETSPPPKHASQTETWTLSAGRLTFYLKQMPALFLLLICGWTLLGYAFIMGKPFADADGGENGTLIVAASTNSSNNNSLKCESPAPDLSLNEHMAAGAAILTAMAAVLGALCGGGRRVTAYKRVVTHCILRVIFAALCIVFSLVAIFYAVLVVMKLHQNNAVTDEGLASAWPPWCFTPASRLVANVAALAATTFILILSLFSFAFGCVALSELSSERKFMRRIGAR